MKTRIQNPKDLATDETQIKHGYGKGTFYKEAKKAGGKEPTVGGGGKRREKPSPEVGKAPQRPPYFRLIPGISGNSDFFLSQAKLGTCMGKWMLEFWSIGGERCEMLRVVARRVQPGTVSNFVSRAHPSRGCGGRYPKP